MTNANEFIRNIPNILIVDDVSTNLKILGAILKNEGYKVRPVPNGILALQVAEKEKPDLILLDIMMPDIDGYEVCRRLKESPKLRDVPVIFISALSEPDDIVKALNSGGVDYITKPFRADEVKARVAMHLKLFQQSKEIEELKAAKYQLFGNKLEIKAALQIQKPIHEVFEAIVDPKIMSNYFISESSGRMEKGKTLEWRFPELDLIFPVRVGTIENDRFISYYWNDADGTETLVEITLSVKNKSTFVSITEKARPLDEEGINWLRRNTEGWANFLACLKAYLEFGINLRKGAFDLSQFPEQD
jgi:CheY-like chemotaxis protein/uncharacterized protein YndB with AHSA1/START domain